MGIVDNLAKLMMWDEVVERIDHFPYIRSFISPGDGLTSEEISSQTRKAWLTFPIESLVV